MERFGAIVWLISAVVVFGIAYRSYTNDLNFSDNSTAENIFYSGLAAIMTGICVALMAMFVVLMVKTAFGYEPFN